MIPINELRIGNKFYYPPFYDGGKGDCIGEIESIYMQDAYPSEGFICLINIELETEYDSPIAKSDHNNRNINPIPLTPEILEKCGFEKYDEENDRWVLSGFGSYHMAEKSFYFGTTSLKIEFLHELQNLHYTLKKEELTINLP